MKRVKVLCLGTDKITPEELNPCNYGVRYYKINIINLVMIALLLLVVMFKFL